MRIAKPSKHEGFNGRWVVCAAARSGAGLRKETHSSHCGRKTRLNFERKDLQLPEAARQSKLNLSGFGVANAGF